MPELRELPEIPHADLDTGPLRLGAMTLDEAEALALVTTTFNKYETFRSQNHDLRWNTHDALYYGWLPAKVWEGTSIPRASLGQPIVFDQVETAVPSIMNNLFGYDPDWFQIEAGPGTEPQQAQQVKDHLTYILDEGKTEYSLGFRKEIEMAVRSTLLYGNGGIQLEWNEKLQRPTVEWVDTRDLYVDPGCPTPNIDESSAVIRRRWFTVDELSSMRGLLGMNIPEDEFLYTMARNYTYTFSDQTKRIQESFRGVNFQPGASDYNPNPADRKIEVLVYQSKHRIIWVLGRRAVGYRGQNPYGFQNFCFAPCYAIPGRFYAQSVADVNEGIQRYIEALLNYHLDARALDLQPPRSMKGGTLMTPNQQRWSPNAIFTVGEKDDMTLMQPKSAISNVFEDIDYLEKAADKRTGISSLSTGVPRPSNANRSAKGMQMQLQGSNTRLMELVSNFEEYLLIPMLKKLKAMIEHHTPDNAILTGQSQGQNTAIPAKALKGGVKMRILASSRMLTKEDLMQSFGYLAQNLMSGQMLGQMNSIGQTIDWDQFFKMMQDATGIRKLYKLIRPMTDQEKQQQQSDQQAKQQADQQAQQQDMQTRTQIMQMKGQSDQTVAQIQGQSGIEKAKISKGRSPEEMQQEKMMADAENAREERKAQMELQAAQQKSDIEAQNMERKAQYESMMARIKMAGKQEEMQHDKARLQMEHQAGQQQMGLKLQESQSKAQMSQAEGRLKLQQQYEQGLMGRQQMAQKGEQDLALSKSKMQQQQTAAAIRTKKPK